jgi:hypothetical protein
MSWYIVKHLNKIVLYKNDYIIKNDNYLFIHQIILLNLDNVSAE